MGQAVAFTGAEFEEQVLKSSVPVLVDFWAVWCGPCKMIAPHVEALATEYDGRVKVGKVNIDEERDITEKYGIMSIPTLLFFKDGKVVDQVVGAVPKSTIASKLESLLRFIGATGSRPPVQEAYSRSCLHHARRVHLSRAVQCADRT